MTQKYNKGRYEVLDTLGQGRHSDVFEAYDSKIQERVAIKILDASGKDQSIAKAMFRKEVDALTFVKHDHIIKMLDHFVENEEELGLGLELIPNGKTLKHFIEETLAGKHVKKSLVWRIEQLLNLLDALNTAHNHKIIHRDIKPSNILYDGHQQKFKISDFGIARVFAHYGSPEAIHTTRNYYSRPYAAPEQLLQKETSFATDIYAFGMLTLALLTYQLPDDKVAVDDVHVMMGGLHQELSDLGQEDVCGPLEDLIVNMLHPDPLQRPKMVEVEVGLENVLYGIKKKPNAFLHLAPSFRFKPELGRLTPAEVFQDVNQQPHARLDIRQTEQDEPETIIKIFGKTLTVVVRFDRDTKTNLVVVDVFRSAPEDHARNRLHAPPLPFVLHNEIGDSSEFLEHLNRISNINLQEKEERQARRNFFDVGRFLLEKQEDYLEEICLTCSLNQPSEDKRSQWHESNEYYVLDIEEITVSNPRMDSDPKSITVQELLARLDASTVLQYFGTHLGTVEKLYPTDSRLVVKPKVKNPKLPEGRSFQLTIPDTASKTPIDRQIKALRRFEEQEATNPKLGNLLTHPEDNTIGTTIPVQLHQNLSPKREMRHLVSRVLAAEDMFLIQGPPGTGKTTLITEVILQILQRDPNARILLSAQANEAVNNALERVAELTASNQTDIRIIRDIREYAEDDSKLKGFEKNFYQWVERTRLNSQRHHQENQGHLDSEQKQKVQERLQKWQEHLDRYLDVRRAFADSCHIIGATCVRVPALARHFNDMDFDWVIVDEAAKALPTEVLIPMTRGKKILLVGDHKQLPPFVSTALERDLKGTRYSLKEAKTSLFERLFELMPDSNKHTLRTQYRMHHSIADFVSAIAYQEVGGLETGVPDEDRDVLVPKYQKPCRVFWLNFTQGQEERTGTSFANAQEAHAIRRELQAIERSLHEQDITYEVGIIAPYAAQVEKLKGLLSPNSPQWKKLKIDIDTVDAFQGKQKDIMVYSLTRSAHTDWKFIADEQRLNVAFSRAKRLLLIVGNTQAAVITSDLRRIHDLIPAENHLDIS